MELALALRRAVSHHDQSCMASPGRYEATEQGFGLDSIGL
jgi:hypothetical protein